MIGRPFVYPETDFEAKYETDFEEIFFFALFWSQNVMMVRYIFSYVEQVDERDNYNRYYARYKEFKIRYGLWAQPKGREDIFAY